MLQRMLIKTEAAFALLKLRCITAGEYVDQLNKIRHEARMPPLSEDNASRVKILAEQIYGSSLR